MKATIEFNLPEDDSHYKMATRSQEYFSALWDIQMAVRDYTKYSHDAKMAIIRIQHILEDVELFDIE